MKQGFTNPRRLCDYEGMRRLSNPKAGFLSVIQPVAIAGFILAVVVVLSMLLYRQYNGYQANYVQPKKAKEAHLAQVESDYNRVREKTQRALRGDADILGEVAREEDMTAPNEFLFKFQKKR